MNFEKEQNNLPLEKARLFSEYADKFSDMKEISLEDLAEMKERGLTTEEFLDFLASENDYLFHGSRVELSAEEKILPNEEENKIHASNNPAIAIMKVINSNKGVNLHYPIVITEDFPLELLVEDTKDSTVGEKGFVYIIQKNDEFINTKEGSFQYVKENDSESFIKRIEVEKDDFNYPVELK